MSTTSGLIDELNKSADEWSKSNMFELASMCRRAADTIMELRDDLQRTNAENAKLRELVSHLYKCMCNVDAFGSHECDLCEYDNAEDKCDFERLMHELDLSKDVVSRHINNKHETKFDEERYRRVLSLLEEAVQLMSEWGCR